MRYSTTDAPIALSLREAEELKDSVADFAGRYGYDEEATCFRDQSWAKNVSLKLLTVSKSLIDLRFAG